MEQSPNGCSLCAHDARTHGTRIDDPERGGVHTYQAPDSNTIKQRMVERRSQRA